LRQDEDQRPGQQEAQALRQAQDDRARPNEAPSADEQGRDAGRSGSDSDAS
jgi:hypothetical protein